MRRTVLAIALMLGAVCANAQETTSSGDLYEGLTRKIAFERMIPPHGLEITYDKTVHIIFPSTVRYVDLGSPNLIAGKADGAENVIRVKATVKEFREETNMSVITEDGAFYTFNVKYADEPLLLNVMKSMSNGTLDLLRSSVWKYSSPLCEYNPLSRY